MTLVLGKSYWFGQPIIRFWKVDTLRLLNIHIMFVPTVELGKGISSWNSFIQCFFSIIRVQYFQININKLFNGLERIWQYDILCKIKMFTNKYYRLILLSHSCFSSAVQSAYFINSCRYLLPHNQQYNLELSFHHLVTFFLVQFNSQKLHGLIKEISTFLPAVTRLYW